MGYFNAVTETARWEAAEKHRAEGRIKGLDLPYPDEAVELLKELDQGGASVGERAAYYLGLSERERLRMIQSRWNIHAPSDDYYDLILQAVAQELCRAHLAELKQQVRRFAKLVH